MRIYGTISPYSNILINSNTSDPNTLV